MCAGGTNAEEVSWRDLSPVVKEEILARVPLICLAQLASVSKDLQTAYQQRYIAQVGAVHWQQHLSESLPTTPCKAHAENPAWSHPWLTMENSVWGTCRVVGLDSSGESSSACKGDDMEMTHNIRVISCPATTCQVSGQSDCELDYAVAFLYDPANRQGRVCASVKCSAVLGLIGDSMVCNEIILRCYHGDILETKIGMWLTLCTAMAAPLQSFLHDVLSELAHDRMQGGKAGLAHLVTVGLPSGGIEGLAHSVTLGLPEGAHAGSVESVMQGVPQGGKAKLAHSVSLGFPLGVLHPGLSPSRKHVLPEGPHAGVAHSMMHVSPRGAHAGLVRSVTLVLPRGDALPNGAENAVVCDALTCFVALVGGKPSGVRIAVARGQEEGAESSWRLPCIVGGG
jgi:hypothetical protein